MRPFVYQRANDAASAAQALSAAISDNAPLTQSGSQPLAGGTTLLDLMKLDVMRPDLVIDINPLARQWSAIAVEDGKLRLGAMARMSDVAANPAIQRDYPLIADSLKLAASPQLRNMATLGGNVLQRTRCSYFRDVSYDNCNKRNPGSGCAALDGFNRTHAVLGSERRVHRHLSRRFRAGDDRARRHRRNPRTVRGAQQFLSRNCTSRRRNLRRSKPRYRQGDLISGFTIDGRWPRSLYLKARDRQSYEFALASAAIALDVKDGVIGDARVALGGVATIPWRAREAEALLKGQKFDDALATRAAEAAFTGAAGRKHNAFKIALGKRVVARALHQAAAMEV